MPDSLARCTARLVRSGTSGGLRKHALVGFDGFADTILHVVKERESAENYERFDSRAGWSARITAAAGLSANFELVPQSVKLGGNGPIVANALVALGLGGTLGKPALHPVFEDFAKRAGVISLVEPRFTDAFEFACGKRMCGKLASLRDVNWRNLAISSQPRQS